MRTICFAFFFLMSMLTQVNTYAEVKGVLSSTHFHSKFDADTLHRESSTISKVSRLQSNDSHSAISRRPYYHLSNIGPISSMIPGTGKRRAGKILIFGGSGLLVLGAMGLSAANSDYSDGAAKGFYGVLGVTALTYGVVASVTGIILWRRGNKKIAQHQKETTSMNITQRGVTLRYRF